MSVSTTQQRGRKLRRTPKLIASAAALSMLAVPLTQMQAASAAPAPNSGFGNTFPDVSARGDSFVRTDVAPNQLFKFNGNRWILVDKAAADNYTYDIAYIDHLIDKINNGSYDVDLLSASEQEQVAQRLQTKTNNT